MKSLNSFGEIGTDFVGVLNTRAVKALDSPYDFANYATLGASDLRRTIKVDWSVCMSKLEELSKQYSVLLKTLLEHGDSSINPQINQIKSILDLLKFMPSDASEDMIIEKVRKMNDFLYAPRVGLAEFYIWSDDFDERIKLNEPLDIAKKTTWNILNHPS